ncbi:MAG: cobalt ECF transporter T component CbiQ [Nitrospirota bacterium]
MELLSEHSQAQAQAQAGKHLLSIDARIKILASMLLLLMITSYRGFAFPLFVSVLSVLLCRKMKVSFRTFLLRFSEPLFIVSVLVLLKLFLSGRDVLFSFDLFGLSVTGHRDGLLEGLEMACRIVGAVSVVAVLGFSTPFAELMAGLSWLRVPRGFIEILMLAYRYIFVLFEEAMVIYQAQRNRLGYSSMRRGLASFGTLTGALVLKAFEQSQNTTVSMVQRGYDGAMPLLKHKPFKRSEAFASVLFIVVMGCLWSL